jgi:hypothetical protein
MGMVSSGETPGGFVTKRIAIACADHELRVRTMTELQGTGTSLSALADLTGFPVEAKGCDVVLMFADGFRAQSLVACLDALDCCRFPMLVIVTDQAQPPWTRKNGINRLPTVVTRSVWEAKGLAVVQMRNREESAEYEDLRPELPFTD